MGSAGPTPTAVDAIVIGAGFSGISALHKLRQLNLKVKVFEAGTDPHDPLLRAQAEAMVLDLRRTLG